jgi:short-subunit dehydrogenase
VLALAARRETLLKEVADEITGAGHARPKLLPADLAIRGAAAKLGARALAELGGLDVLVNNAGSNLTGPESRIADSDPARAVFETNLWTPLALTTAVLPTMRAAGRGLIVNVTSTVQAVPFPLVAYYAASKAALAQATRSLRLELASTPIRVMEVVPGSTDTALRNVDELPWKNGAPRTPRPVTAEAMATAMVRAIARGKNRLVYPRTSLLPLELPVIGRIVAGMASGRIDTLGAIG